MKKNNILKVLGITFLAFVVLSWIIPAGTYASGAYQSVETVVPVSLYGLFRLPILTIGTFIQYGLLFIVIGGFYGIFSKTGVYTTIVEKITKSQKSNKLFIYIVAVVFALMSALTALPNLLFVFVPLFATILLKLGYNKLTTFSATVGAMLVGQIGNILGFNIWGYFVYFYDISMFEEIVIRIIVSIVTIGLFLVLFKTKEETKKQNSKKEDVQIPHYEEVKTKKSILPFIITSSIFFVLLIIGLYNWAIAFEIEFFADMYESLMSLEVNGYLIMNNIFTDLPELGFWGNYEMAVILFILSLIIGWLYSLKLDEIVEAFAEGAKKMIPVALFATLASLIFATILNSQLAGTSASFVNTIINNLMPESANGLSVIATSAVGSFAYNDFYNLLSNVGIIYSDVENLAGNMVLIQIVNGLVMLIAPVSIYLIAGLAYMDIKYTEWFKHIWKYALYIFIFVIVLSFIIV